MSLLSRFSRGELRLGRIEAFSDGVFAIVATLLVLDLRVPSLVNHTNVAELGSALLNQLPKFLSWLISFVIVCKFWLNHHHVLGQARHANYALVWLNSIFLMFQSFVPFPTAIMGEYPENPLAISFFGCVMALNTVLFILLQSYVQKNLLKPEWKGAEDPHLLAKSLVGPASYLVGVACAWWNVYAAFAVYFLTPWFFITPPEPRPPSASGGTSPTPGQ